MPRRSFYSRSEANSRLGWRPVTLAHRALERLAASASSVLARFGKLRRDSVTRNWISGGGKMLSRITAVLASALLSMLALAGHANAAFPGANGKIAFERGGNNFW